MCKQAITVLTTARKSWTTGTLPLCMYEEKLECILNYITTLVPADFPLPWDNGESILDDGILVCALELQTKLYLGIYLAVFF